MNQLVHHPQQLASFVDSLLMPITATTLLLPVSAIFEVVDDIDLQPADDNSSTADSQPDWLYGTVQWRENSVKVLCYEALVGAGKNGH